MKIEYPIQWDERDNFERPCKGWLSGVIAITDDGVCHELAFWDPGRLRQDLEEELKQGRIAIIEKGLIVVPEVTRENIEKAILQAEAEGYFKKDSVQAAGN